MSKKIISVAQIARRISYFRGEKILFDFDLAALYGVAAKVLNQAVTHHRERFPNDFMFRLTDEKTRIWRSQFLTFKSQQPVENDGDETNSSQFVTSSSKFRGRKYRPYAFTEQGVAMLSSVLRSERAVKVNIAIMRTFVKLRQMLETNRELAKRFSQLEQRVDKRDEEIAGILEAIRQLMAPPNESRREIGFHAREKSPTYRARKRA